MLNIFFLKVQDSGTEPVAHLQYDTQRSHRAADPVLPLAEHGQVREDTSLCLYVHDHVLPGGTQTQPPSCHGE